MRTALTDKMRAVLRQVAEPVTPRMAESGHPGWPDYTMDRRSLEALETRGLVQCQMRTGDRLPLCYVLTDAGREVIAAMSK